MDVSTTLGILVSSTMHTGLEKDLAVSPSDGQGEISESPRALKEGEIGEWILLDGVSPSC